MAEETAHLRILNEDVIGVAKVYVVTPDGEQFELEGVRNVNLNFDNGAIPTMNLEMTVGQADVVTLHRPGMK